MPILNRKISCNDFLLKSNSCELSLIVLPKIKQDNIEKKIKLNK